MSLVWSLDRVTQSISQSINKLYLPSNLQCSTHYASSNGWFIPSFPFCGKNSNPEHARKNCKVLRVVYTQGRRIFYYPHGICFSGLYIEKTVLRWNEYSFCSYMGPNHVRIMDQMASRLSVRRQVSLIKTDTYDQLDFVFVSVVVRRFATRGVFRLFAVNIFNLSRPRLIKLAKIWKPLLLL